ncbi:MAG: hypothetical protein V3T23_07535 [Nitrososphaerales archaeon]
MNQMTDPERIALIDMDDTVADFESAIARDYNKMVGPGELFYSEASRLYKRDDWPDHLWARMDAIKRQPGWWRNLVPLAVGFEIIDVLKGFDFNFHAATAGPSTKSQAWAEKLEWAREHMPYANVHVTEDKSLLYGKILVDDWPPYAGKWLVHRPRGLIIMPAHHYNEYVDHPQIFRYSPGMQAQLTERVRQLVEC